MSNDRDNIVFVVYDPPRVGFPYLSVVFVPGKEEPMVTPFKTVAEAEAFNRLLATKMAQSKA